MSSPAEQKKAEQRAAEFKLIERSGEDLTALAVEGRWSLGPELVEDE